MIFTKGAHQSTEFQTFDCSDKISPNLYFDRLLLLNVYTISAIKVQRCSVSWYRRVMQNLKKKQFVISKIQESGEFWSEHSKVSKICTLIGPFHAKYITFDLKKYRGVIFHDREESYKIWRKTDLWFGKWHKEFGKFSPEQTKVSKCFSLESTEELCFMALKIDTKFEEKLTCASKNDVMTNFHESTWSSQNWDFDGILLSKLENLWS